MLSSQPYRILIVDDVADNLFLMQTVLETEGYFTDTASSGSEALAMLKKAAYNLVLLDVMMPDMNGLDVTQHIRQDRKLVNLPILLITAHDRAIVNKGLSLGADDFIRKPVDFDQLLLKIKKTLHAHSEGNWAKVS